MQGCICSCVILRPNLDFSESCNISNSVFVIRKSNKKISLSHIRKSLSLMPCVPKWCEHNIIIQTWSETTHVSMHIRVSPFILKNAACTYACRMFLTSRLDKFRTVVTKKQQMVISKSQKNKACCSLETYPQSSLVGIFIWQQHEVQDMSRFCQINLLFNFTKLNIKTN